MLLRFNNKVFDHADLVHAVTMRAGGVSKPPHDTLNMSFSRPDEAAAVRENRRRVYRALEITPERVVQAGQVHGNAVLVVGEQHAGCGALDRSSVLPPADAMITDQPDLYLLACFADCVPLLFYDPRRRAVGVAHAGWQGTTQKIGAATVAAMTQTFGTDPADLQVVIGPSAGPCCYNVWPHVAATIRETLSTHAEVLQERNGATFFDLWTANKLALLEQGVRQEHIETCGLCTIDHADRFFSHRGGNGLTGRFAAIIGVRG